MFNQVSAFGAWLDVVLDNFGRGLLWVYLFKYGFVITCIEWLAFCCTQSHGAYWKEVFTKSPFIVGLVFKNNFKTPIGITAISAGLQGLPVWLYFLKHYGAYLTPGWDSFGGFILLYCLIGRALCGYVEIWVIWKNLEKLITEHDNTQKK